jgi:hypothetical protein
MQRVIQRLLIAALFAVILAVVSHTRADPDLWGHVRFGHDTVAAHGIVRADRYSFASDVPWINHEWLAEVITYLAYAVAGGFGLALLKVLIVAATLLVVARSWPEEVPARLRLWLVGAVLIGTVPQANHVRPQLFSLLLFALLLQLLVTGTRPARRIVPVMMVFILWVNLHGGWIVGGGALAVWVCCAVAGRGDARQRLEWIVVGVAALVATLVNPYGWRLWTFLWSTVGLGRADISDWQPVYALGTAYVIIWLFIAGVAVALLRQHIGRRTLDVPGVVLVLLLAFASFRVNRLLAFFAIAATMLLTRGWHSEQPEARRPAPEPSRASVWFAAAVGALLFAGALVVTVQNVTCVRIEDERYPEREAAPAMEAAGLSGRMLSFFDWGEYAIWYLPHLSVSLDGRRETVYSDAVVREQVAMYFDPSTRQAVLRQLQPDYAWLPANLPLTAALEQDGWTTIFAGPRSVLLSAHPHAPLSVPQLAAARRCFPGP